MYVYVQSLETVIAYYAENVVLNRESFFGK